MPVCQSGGKQTVEGGNIGLADDVDSLVDALLYQLGQVFLRFVGVYGGVEELVVGDRGGVGVAARPLGVDVHTYIPLLAGSLALDGEAVAPIGLLHHHRLAVVGADGGACALVDEILVFVERRAGLE